MLKEYTEVVCLMMWRNNNVSIKNISIKGGKVGYAWGVVEKLKSTWNLMCFQLHFAVILGNISESKLQSSTKELKAFKESTVGEHLLLIK